MAIDNNVIENNQQAVAIYTRAGAEAKAARSVEEQIRRCRAFAKAHAMTVVAAFADEASSGTASSRAGLDRLLEATRAMPRPFDVVLVADFARLYPDLVDVVGITQQILAVGLGIVDCTTGADSRDETLS